MAESSFLLRTSLCICSLSNKLSNLRFSLHCLRWRCKRQNWLLLTIQPPQKDCRDVSLDWCPVSWQHQHQIRAKCGLRSRKITFTALLLSSQALKPLHIYNSQLVNYFCMIYKDKHLAILVTDQGTKKTELKKPWYLPHSKVQYVSILGYFSLSTNLEQKYGAAILF